MNKGECGHLPLFPSVVRSSMCLVNKANDRPEGGLSFFSGQGLSGTFNSGQGLSGTFRADAGGSL